MLVNAIMIPLLNTALLMVFPPEKRGSAFFMKDVIPLKNPKIDFLSIILSTAGFGLMLYGFSNIGNKGWGDIIVITNIFAGTLISALPNKLLVHASAVINMFKQVAGFLGSAVEKTVAV